MEEICILWFRQDLRLNDNPALIEANNSGIKILPVYILDDVNSGNWKIGSASRWWLNESLKKLNDSLNNNLCFMNGDSIKCLDSNESQQFQDRAEVLNRLEQNKDTIEIIRKHIDANNQQAVPWTKRELIQHIANETGIGEKKIRNIVTYHEGDDWNQGYRWTGIKVGNERTKYINLQPPV